LAHSAAYEDVSIRAAPFRGKINFFSTLGLARREVYFAGSWFATIAECESAVLAGGAGRHEKAAVMASQAETIVS